MSKKQKEKEVEDVSSEEDDNPLHIMEGRREDERRAAAAGSLLTEPGEATEEAVVDSVDTVFDALTKKLERGEPVTSSGVLEVIQRDADSVARQHMDFVELCQQKVRNL